MCCRREHSGLSEADHLLITSTPVCIRCEFTVAYVSEQTDLDLSEVRVIRGVYWSTQSPNILLFKGYDFCEYVKFGTHFVPKFDILSITSLVKVWI